MYSTVVFPAKPGIPLAQRSAAPAIRCENCTWWKGREPNWFLRLLGIRTAYLGDCSYPPLRVTDRVFSCDSHILRRKTLSVLEDVRPGVFGPTVTLPPGDGFVAVSRRLGARSATTGDLTIHRPAKAAPPLPPTRPQ